MNPILILIFVIFILGILFLSLFSLFKLVFFSLGNGVGQNFGNILLSPPTSGSQIVPVFLSAIFASIISVVIIILGVVIVIRKRKHS